jgi:predicted short-subunit dehydrogenase-like oxidoreductase (DUF2520 family)
LVRILIVGPGRVGCTLAYTHLLRGDEVSLVGHRAGPWQAWAESVKLSTEVGFASTGALDVLLFCVPDDQLHAITAAWSEHLTRLESAPALVAHTGGLHGLTELAVFQAKSTVAALHPILVFQHPEASALALQNAAVTALWSGSEALVLQLTDAWQARFLPIPELADRRLYHLSLCLAANHCTALMAEAEKLLGPSLGDQARGVLLELASAALASVQANGPADALTGPVVRGDLATLQAHLAALPDSKARQRYLQSLMPVLDLADQSGRLAAEPSKLLHDWLEAQT